MGEQSHPVLMFKVFLMENLLPSQPCACGQAASPQIRSESFSIWTPFLNVRKHKQFLTSPPNVHWNPFFVLWLLVGLFLFFFVTAVCSLKLVPGLQFNLLATSTTLTNALLLFNVCALFSGWILIYFLMIVYFLVLRLPSTAVMSVVIQKTLS